MSKVLFSNSNVKGEIITLEMVESLNRLNLFEDRYVIVKTDCAKFMAEFDGITFNVIRDVCSKPRYMFRKNPIEVMLNSIDSVLNVLGEQDEYPDLFVNKFLPYLCNITINSDNNTILIVSCNNRLEADKIFESKSFKANNTLFMCKVDFIEEQKHSYHLIFSKGEKYTEYQLSQFITNMGFNKDEIELVEIDTGLLIILDKFDLQDCIEDIQSTIAKKDIRNSNDSGFVLNGTNCTLTVHIFNPSNYPKYNTSDKVIRLFN